jgi:hypothetical protein
MHCSRNFMDKGYIFASIFGRTRSWFILSHYPIIWMDGPRRNDVEFAASLVGFRASFQGCDYEECRLLGYKNPVCTSKETHYISAREPSRLMLCKI